MPHREIFQMNEKSFDAKDKSFEADLTLCFYELSERMVVSQEVLQFSSFQPGYESERRRHHSRAEQAMSSSRKQENCKTSLLTTIR